MEYDLDCSPSSRDWLQRTESWTARNSFSTEPLIVKSIRTAISPNSSSYINIKSSVVNYLNKAARNATSIHLYKSRTSNWTPRSHSRTRMMNTVPHLGFHQSSMKLGHFKENAYIVCYSTIYHIIYISVYLNLIISSITLQTVVEYKQKCT